MSDLLAVISPYRYVDTVDTELFCCFTVYLRIIEEQTFSGSNTYLLKHRFVDVGIRLCHAHLLREETVVEITTDRFWETVLFDVPPMCIICIGEQVGGITLLTKLLDEVELVAGDGQEA